MKWFLLPISFVGVMKSHRCAKSSHASFSTPWMISENGNRRIMSNPKAKLFCVLSALSLVISGTLPAFAQETTSGAAAGKVYDIANTQGIGGARVQVTN